MTPKLFSDLGLSAEILKAIDKLGFEKAAPIQAEAIPVLMSGRDVVGQSQTGSGKTAAFAIPAIEKTDPNLKTVQVLVLCPTRELAVQVAEEIHKLSFFKRGISSLPIYGGQSYERQFLGLRQGAQIVIGTPGRVMDHMRRGTIRLDKIKMVILDEADVMLNMGFRDDIETILKDAPKERQTVFFSATMPRPIRDLIEKYSRDPQNVKVEQKAMTVSTVEQVYYEVDRRYKIELLTRLIDIHDLKLGIIFCNTKRMVDDLVDHLEAQGYMADRLHGDMTQAQRDRVMGKFRKSGLEFLVATDIAARGIDVDDVQVVFNYDLPYDAEDYVHRIGRTGRAGRSGRAISFVSGRELFQIRNIERFTNMRIQRGKTPTADEVHEARANVFLEKLRALLTSGEYQKHDRLIERLLEEGFASTDVASALIHLLQHGEGAAAKPAKTEEYERPKREERTSFSERGDRRPNFDNRRDERPRRFEDRPSRAEAKFAAPVKSKTTPWKAAAAAPVKKIIPPPAAKPPVEVTAEAVKTFSDAEILAAVKTPEAKPESKLFLKPKSAPVPAPKPKVSRATPADQTRLWI
ncbi:MAG TPA: DEAD/DEAH box helicase, partial [Verrucomicrobiae bacterium]|nr:DEAD/DEAH box helicase [Verrucomicrobiae bacterium]